MAIREYREVLKNSVWSSPLKVPTQQIATLRDGLRRKNRPVTSSEAGEVSRASAIAPKRTCRMGGRCSCSGNMHQQLQ
jgi:hypothetical protein